MGRTLFCISAYGMAWHGMVPHIIQNFILTIQFPQVDANCARCWLTTEKLVRLLVTVARSIDGPTKVCESAGILAVMRVSQGSLE